MIILKGAHVIDPQFDLDGVMDVAIDGDSIVQVGENIDYETAACASNCDLADIEVVDCTGKILVPGLVDIHVHLREPGYEHKETIETGTRAAVHGGFTGICAMPNTNPVTDNAMIVEYVKARAAAANMCKVYVSGACTKGLESESISEMGDMVSHGVVAFTDDGKGVKTAGMMRRVMDYASQFDKVVMSHCQDESIVGAGQVNEGPISTKLGLLGWPAEGEELQIIRDIAISRLTGCALHIQHISTKRGLDAVRAAKAEGLKVTCEATPHHMFLADEDITSHYETNLKVNPPLRSRANAQAVVEGVLDGSVDVIVTDHAPHSESEKSREFELAPFGMVGIETVLGLVITHLVRSGKLKWQRLVELMSINPRKILRLDQVSISAGSKADITLIDPNISWEVDASEFESKASNSGFLGAHLVGKATDVIVDGSFKMKNGVVG